MAIGVAILGAGIFAKTEHLPAVQACSALDLKAVYSRSEKSAASLASSVSNKTVDVYYDSPSNEDRSLKKLLARDDIEAVIIALPILSQPAVITQAIEAGKHVLSEKPIAKDLETGSALIKWYHALDTTRKPLWAVAENYRYMQPWLKAAELLKRIGGKLVTFNLKSHTLMSESSQYYHTSWRQTPGYQGGFVLDGGVHYAAGLRLLLAAVNEQVTSVSAFSSLVNEKLPPVDTVNASLQTGTGVTGTFTATWSSTVRKGTSIEVITTNGLVVASAVDVTLKTKNSSGKVEEEHHDFGWSSGVEAEVASFAEGISKGKLDERELPTEALYDLQLIEQILTSGDKHGEVQKLPQQLV